VLDVRRLRATCEEHLAAVPVPSPFNLREFCDAVGAYRGRPIHLFESEGPFTDEHPSGAWSPMDDEDHIYVATGLAPAHRVQVVLHEVGHMLWGHDPAATFKDPGKVRVITPQLSTVALRRMLFRTRYVEPVEREAETYASLAMEQAGIVPAAAHTGHRRELVSRLAESLGHPMRRTGGHHG
jgi:hypothetical protein